MAPLVAALVKNGLGILANAVLAKGKEAVEEKIGIKLPELGSEPSQATLSILKQAEMQHEEVLTAMALESKRIDADLEKEAGKNVTQRWQSDMASDSWLSKNIRPMTLAYLLAVVSLFAFLEGVSNFDVPKVYIELFGSLLQTVFGAYFVGRAVVQGVEVWGKIKNRGGRNGSGD